MATEYLVIEVDAKPRFTRYRDLKNALYVHSNPMKASAVEGLVAKLIPGDIVRLNDSTDLIVINA